MEGYQSGLISRGGVGFGYDETSNVSNTEWLPGCCIMHESKNLILENFYFWDGKAYSEDLYHSYYLKKNGVKLIFDKNSKLYVSSGSGCWGPKLRIGSSNEIINIQLTKIS